MRRPCIRTVHFRRWSCLTVPEERRTAWWLAHRLAKCGFVAIVNHHGNTAIEPYLPEGFLCWWERQRISLCCWTGCLGRPAPGRTTHLLAHTRRRHRSWRDSRRRLLLGGYTVLSAVGAVTEMARFSVWAERRYGQGPGGVSGSGGPCAGSHGEFRRLSGFLGSGRR